MVEIPKFLQDKVANAPEFSYGAARVTVILKNGQRIPDVIVAWGREIVKCAGKDEIPFTQNDISDIAIPDRKLGGNPAD